MPLLRTTTPEFVAPKKALPSTMPIRASPSVELIDFTFRYYIDNPGFVRMINTENLHKAAHLRGAPGMEALNRSILTKVQAILDLGVAKGVFRAGVDPLDLYISISALSFTYVSNRHTLEVLFGRKLLAPEAVEARLATMTDMILRFLAAD